MIVVSRQPGYRVHATACGSQSGRGDSIAAAAAMRGVRWQGGIVSRSDATPDRLYLTRVLAQIDGDTFFPSRHCQWQRFRGITRLMRNNENR
jgi:hypothetical protein